MKWIRKALNRPPVACAVISLLIFAAVLGLRATGWLQPAELFFYDQFVKRHSDRDSTDPRIVLVGMTEDDLTKYGYPLDDRKLAQVILGVDKLDPCVIGLDLYRDLPEPRSREYYPELEAALKKVKRLMAIERLGYFGPPPALADEPDRIVANNLPRDNVDGYYRRGPLAFETKGQAPEPSLSLGVTLEYLKSKGIEFSFEGDPPLIRLNKTIIPRLTPDAGGYVPYRFFAGKRGSGVGVQVDDYEYLANYQAPRRYRHDLRRVAGRDLEQKDSSYDWSFGDVLEGRVPADALKGKIVLMATVMHSIKDSNPTPIDPDLRGVQIHAMLVHQLLEAAINGKAPMTWWPEWAELLWIATFTGMGGVLSLFLRSPWKLAPALIVALGGLVVAAWLAFGHGTWLLVAAPAIGCFVAATFVASFIAYLERSERDTMQNIFARHVSSDVVDTLWEARDQFLEGGRLKPQRLTCTVMFTDLKGFSTISEGMEPAELMNWMNEYMDAVARHVDLHDGVVNSYIGDAIMALFGAPVAHTLEEEIDRDAVNAVKCALAMRGEMEKLNQGWTARGMPNVAMRIGIYTGPLVAGSLGSADRLMFTVLGDTTNTAARLEGAGKDLAVNEYTKLCTILIGEATLQRLGDQFVTEYVGPMSLKGKANQIIVHSVLYAKPAAGAAGSDSKTSTPSNTSSTVPV
ncbi:MAG TPA: adenylate/guanylate cyclase domain-containing protein [Chthoniobacteraceae bacterium]|jgi:adenylate cyclase|nr:adenylate/guanylate cyclase domain-containing protein [Chthoniobacteraceae bacterium]